MNFRQADHVIECPAIFTKKSSYVHLLISFKDFVRGSKSLPSFTGTRTGEIEIEPECWILIQHSYTGCHRNCWSKFAILLTTNRSRTIVDLGILIYLLPDICRVLDIYNWRRKLLKMISFQINAISIRSSVNEANICPLEIGIHHSDNAILTIRRLDRECFPRHSNFSVTMTCPAIGKLLLRVTLNIRR